MKEYVSSAIYVHPPETEHLIERLREHASQPSITPVLIDTLISGQQDKLLTEADHVVVSGSLSAIRKVIQSAEDHGFSVGVIPTDKQRKLGQFYDIPNEMDPAMDLALETDPIGMDLVKCNGHIVLNKATIGQMPILDAPSDTGRFGILKAALARIFKIDLIKSRFATAGAGEIVTAASGCIILNNKQSSIAGRLIAKGSGIADGTIRTLISAPISVIKYLKFLFSLSSRIQGSRKPPSSIGYIKSSAIEIEPGNEMDVWIDGEKLTRMPFRCEVTHRAIRVNVGPAIRAEASSRKLAEERVEIDNLPRGKELKKAWKREKIPYHAAFSSQAGYGRNAGAIESVVA
jgi:diacylglycerol kinase family enzyme